MAAGYITDEAERAAQPPAQTKYGGILQMKPPNQSEPLRLGKFLPAVYCAQKPGRRLVFPAGYFPYARPVFFGIL
jgi:hypothetical protein